MFFIVVVVVGCFCCSLFSDDMCVCMKWAFSNRMQYCKRHLNLESSYNCFCVVFVTTLTVQCTHLTKKREITTSTAKKQHSVETLLVNN